MPRELSADALASLNAQQTGEAWLVLITIDHSSMGSPIRVVNNNEDIVSRGDTFVAFPFELVLPGEDPDGVTKAGLRLDNVDRSVITAIRTLTSPPTVKIEIIISSDMNTPEISFTGMLLRNVSYNAFTIQGDLEFEDLLSEPMTLQMTPSRFPGLF